MKFLLLAQLSKGVLKNFQDLSFYNSENFKGKNATFQNFENDRILAL
jgi:hypothetical protein